MSTHPLPWRTRLGAAAVAAVLVVGVGASLATTAPPEDCPDPPAEGEVSEFFGQQTKNYGTYADFETPTFTAGGLHVDGAGTSLPVCLNAGATTADVWVTLTLAPTDLTPIPEDALRSFTLRDGRGSEWAAVDVYTSAGHPAESDGWGASPASAGVQFTLPVTIDPPLTLHLGDLAVTALTEVLVWDGQDPSR